MVYAVYRNTDFKDRAVFGELTWHITPAWQVTGGVRFFWQTFGVDFESLSPFLGHGPDNPLGQQLVDQSSKVNDHIFKLNMSYDVTPDLKIYGTYSEGFRRGGANAIAGGPFASLPAYNTYAPDRVYNYEAGIKGTLFDRKLHFSADLFLMDFKNFQFNANSPAGAAVVYNGSNARSKGVELELSARLAEGLDVALSYAYTDAKVRDDVTIYDLPVNALSTNPPADPILNIFLPGGTRLPGVPKHILTGSIDYSVPLDSVANGSDLEFHIDGSYQSRSNGAIDPTSSYFWIIPSNFVANARVALTSGQGWGVNLFVRNLTNETGYSGGLGIQTLTNSFAGRYVLRPRTWGVGLNYSF
jgi:outer membrane receptor protein involved in Fe transport